MAGAVADIPTCAALRWPPSDDVAGAVAAGIETVAVDVVPDSAVVADSPAEIPTNPTRAVAEITVSAGTVAVTATWPGADSVPVTLAATAATPERPTTAPETKVPDRDDVATIAAEHALTVANDPEREDVPPRLAARLAVAVVVPEIPATAVG